MLVKFKLQLVSKHWQLKFSNNNKFLCVSHIYLTLTYAYILFSLQICTFGLGSDYNEEVMRGIALSSKGDYYFIEDAKNIPATMSKAIHGLLDTYARDVFLQVRFFPLFF